MTGVAIEPRYPSPTAEPDLERRFPAMAGEVRLRIGAGPADPAGLAEQVVALFAHVESACTRFDPDSPLMRANAAGLRPQQVPAVCFQAITEAFAAYEFTDGMFDPRVLTALSQLGYDRTLPFAQGTIRVDRAYPHRTQRAGERARWEPVFDAARGEVRVGAEPIDLGGIGKGLALRWSAELLAPHCRFFMLEASGDCYLGGTGPDGLGWNVGVESPFDPSKHLAVVTVSDRACATSSIRVRRWECSDRPVHHLIDPRTGEPGRSGLLSVSVVHADPAVAEVLTKVLFLHGADAIAAAAREWGVAALWIGEDGRIGSSEAMEPHLAWQAPCSS